MFKWLKSLIKHPAIRECEKFDDALKRSVSKDKLMAEFAKQCMRQDSKLYKDNFHAIRRPNGIEVFYPIYDGKPYHEASFMLDEQNPTHSVGEFVISLEKGMHVIIETTNERLLRQDYEREVKESRMQITEQLRNLLRAEPDLIQDKEQFCDACQMFFDKPKKRRQWTNAERNIVLNHVMIVEIPVEYPGMG